MTGGLIQLVAKGHQDVFLTEDPQITFFKVVYRRHTNFSVECVPQRFIHKPNFGEKATCILTKSGDMISNMYLVVILPVVPKILMSTGEEDQLIKFAWLKKIGYALIKEINIEIGGKLIDRQYGEWLNVWSELTEHYTPAIQKMIGDVEELTSFSNGKDAYKVYVPLKFWFCRYQGTYLPIGVLHLTEVKINIELNTLDKCSMIGPTNYIQMYQDMVNYIPFEYIEQNIDGNLASGIFISFDITTKRMYYIKLTDQDFQSMSLSILSDESFNLTTVVNALKNPYNEKFMIHGMTSHYASYPSFNAVEKTYHISSQYNLTIKECFLLVDYIYVEDDERKRMYQSKHEYLIEQLSQTIIRSINNRNNTFKVDVHNPSRLFLWMGQQSQFGDTCFNYTNNYRRYQWYNEFEDIALKQSLIDIDREDIYNVIRYRIDESNSRKLYTGDFVGKSLIKKATILLNGYEMLSYRDSDYFTDVQVYQNFKFAPKDGTNIKTFDLFSNQYQPSGSCNMGKINNVQLQFQLDDVINLNNGAVVRVYAICYNVLRFISGHAGVVFSEQI